MRSKKKSGKPAVFPLLMMMLIIAVSIGLLVRYMIVREQRLPVYNPADMNPDLVEASLRGKKNNHRVLPFKVIDQNGDTITDKDYANKIYVANFFFTRCKTICPPMMYHMGILQDALRDDDEVLLLSFSVTPVIDSVPVLQKYADAHKIDARKWHITTGDKKHIYRLARKSYFAALNRGDGELQDFIHTEKFILVDKQKRIRGVYDGTDSSTPEKVLHDIRLLERENGG